MPEFYGEPYGSLVAAAQVTIVEGSAAFTSSTDVYGFSGVALNGTVVELTLSPNSHIALADALILANAEQSSSVAIAHVNHVSESLIEVRMLDDASAPVELPFNIIVFRKGE